MNDGPKPDVKRPQNRGRSFKVRGLLAIALVAAAACPSEANDPDAANGFPLDQMVGRVTAAGGPNDKVLINRATLPPPTETLPQWLIYGDVVTVPEGASVHIDTATQQVDLPHDGLRVWIAPKAPKTLDHSLGGFLSVISNGIMAPVERIVVSAIARGDNDCAAPSDTAPAIAPPAPLAAPRQQIGADLRQLVALWTASPQPRSIFVKLTRGDGAVVTQAATCAGNYVTLRLRSNDLHVGDALGLLISDSRGGSIHYDVTVVAPANLPQPPVQMPEDWLIAAWRLKSGAASTALDSVTRIAKASSDNYGAQVILGAISTDTPF